MLLKVNVWMRECEYFIFWKYLHQIGVKTQQIAQILISVLCYDFQNSKTSSAPKL